MTAVVQTIATHALHGLYLPPDMWCAASYVLGNVLEECVDDMHSQQPLTDTYDRFADVVNEYHYRIEAARDLIDAQWLDYCDTMMAMADLAMTYQHITRGLTAAIELAFSIHCRTVGIADTALYPRIIPPTLDNMRIDTLAGISQTETFLPIFTTEPWVSWLERLRAQQRRSQAVLRKHDAHEVLKSGYYGLADVVRNRAVLRKHNLQRKAAQRSIRRSVAMYGKLNRLADLRIFLQSSADNDKALIVEGKRYDYHLTMHPESLFKETIHLNSKMTPLSTAVFNKAGQQLCNVCIYYRDTPLLDHVLSMMLNVSNAETELDVLNAMIVVQAPRAFYADPILPAMKGLRDPSIAPTFVENLAHHCNTLDEPQTAALDLIWVSALPHARRAFRKIMACEKNYLRAMHQADQFDMWEFISGEPNAIKFLQQYQAEGFA
jgi:hypothetical protein